MTLLLRRDGDIVAIRIVDLFAQTVPHTYAIVTGSYAIEALTGAVVSHVDIDINIFSKDAPDALLHIRGLIERGNDFGVDFVLFKQTPDRLEYDAIYDKHSNVVSRFEIKFVEAHLCVDGQESEFEVRSVDGNLFRIPTKVALLVDSFGRGHEFCVKSLEYLIATWALRISGYAKKQVRSVRSVDKQHFELLLNCDYKRHEVLRMIEQHPQMPSDITGELVFRQALLQVGRSDGLTA